jgi:hypothetical protein
LDPEAVAEERVFGIKREIFPGTLNRLHGTREIEREAASELELSEEELHQVFI